MKPRGIPERPDPKRGIRRTRADLARVDICSSIKRVLIRSEFKKEGD